MRAHKNFTVEFKSRRRQSKPQGASIWKDTDLKAIAREIEDHAPQLFKRPQDQPSPGTVAELEVRQKSSSEENAAVPDTVEQARLAADASELSPVEVISDAKNGAPHADTRPEPITETPPGPAISSPMAKPSSAKPRHSRPRKPAPKQPPAPRPSTIGAGELAELEEENLHLKALLRARLQTENEQLREMLARLKHHR